MDTGRSISFISSRQVNDRLFNHSVHLSSQHFSYRTGRGILRGVPAVMFGFRSVRPHISQANKSCRLGCKEAQIRMSVARVTELSATSETSFDDAVKEAVARATQTLRGVEGAWVKNQNVMIEDGNFTGYKVNVEITFMLEE